jgi:hypothetical protein
MFSPSCARAAAADAAAYSGASPRGRQSKMGTSGLEPETYGLKGRCSTY